MDTDHGIARTTPNEVYGLQPKYLRHNLWDNGSSLSPTTAEWSEHAKPLPRPPLSELSNPVSSKTIASFPHLFQIQTSIKVDIFENLLKDHPNLSFVKSVCDGLREGFWPWANTLSEDFPKTHDESRPMPSDDKKASFIRDQCKKEQDKGYYSNSFGSQLMDGMYSMPIYAVPKPHSEDLRLVTDHSAGPFSLNSMIDHTQVTGFVAWIAKNVKLIPFILDYVDDSSGCTLSNDITFYPPYEKNIPTDQYRLLMLWDELGIPHKPHKQLSGNPLTIIGIEVDANKMTLTLPQRSERTPHQ